MVSAWGVQHGRKESRRLTRNAMPIAALRRLMNDFYRWSLEATTRTTAVWVRCHAVNGVPQVTNARPEIKKLHRHRVARA